MSSKTLCVAKWPLLATLAIMSVAVFVATIAWATAIGSQAMSTEYLVDRVTTESVNGTAVAAEVVTGFDLQSSKYQSTYIYIYIYVIEYVR